MRRDVKQVPDVAYKLIDLLDAALQSTGFGNVIRMQLFFSDNP